LNRKNYKSDINPIWCPGCGHFGVFNAMLKALSAADAKPEECALISGIGCSSRLPAYAATYGFHGVHGRALPVAAGLKVARPELTVFALGGDGDGFSIGGNHFLHACRRNVDIVYVVMDNEVYGMTKGQASPTTPATWLDSKLTPRGPGVRPFQPLAIALAAGAGFIARGFGGDPNGLAKILFEAMQHPGFAFIQVLSKCKTFVPEQEAWKNLVNAFDETTSDPSVAGTLLHSDDGFQTGILYRNPRPVWPVPHEQAQTPPENLRKEFRL
jgi:2-oxoglutarate ferredoxin oxidoreductase subunit beta